MQARAAFWKRKYDEKAAKKARANTKALKKNKKKSTASDMLNLDEDDESETSQAGDDEVTIISSDSEPLPRHKIPRVTWKVSFSHPLAHLDPYFLLN